ncbi:hypothetical protein C8R48DRAFT_672600 [Suillus tomentosus]|jgi:hypothetical protein|nr:hypothetical protein C8R48DRAFT_672600 [Suillus tomentosus]
MAQWTYEWDGGSIIGPRANRISGGSGEANSSLMKGISDGPARLSLANTTLRAHQMDSQPRGRYAIFRQGANRMSEVPGGPIIGTSSEPRVGKGLSPSAALPEHKLHEWVYRRDVLYWNSMEHRM